MNSPTPGHDSTASRRRALPWVLLAFTLVVIAAVFALVLFPGGRVDAGPGDPSAEGPSSTADPASPTPDPTDAPSDDPTDDPVDDPTAAPSDAPTDAPGTSTPTPDPSDSPSPTDAPGSGAPSGGAITTAPGKLREDEASELITLAVAPVPESVTTDSQLSDALSDVAIDAYAEELEAQWLELSSQGWAMTGSPVVTELEISELDASSDPVTAEISACIDSSDVSMTDADGEPIGDPSATTPRALHLFTMVQADDGSWRVAAHSFPDDPRC